MRWPSLFRLSALMIVGTGCYVLAQSPVTSKPNSSIPDDTKALAIQYAKVYRDLARLDYENSLAANRNVQGVISKQTLGALEFSCIYANNALDEAQRESEGAPPDPLQYLSLVAASRQQAYEAAMNSPHFSLPEERGGLERLRLQAEMAQLRLAKAKSLLSKPPVDQVADRVSMMQEDIMLLSQQVARLAVQPSR